MARSLVPAYIRFGGSQSNSYIFEQAYSHDADIDSTDTFLEKQWTLIYQWAKNVGLDLIVCIAPQYIEDESKLHSKNSTNITELLSFSDLMEYNVSWQLGYECQTKCNLSGGDLGKYVANFREMLKSFPRYSNSLITGPDIVAYETAQQQKYLQDYLNSADTALSTITWHPDFASVSLNDDGIFMSDDDMVADKNELDKIINHTVEKKPLWIAESKPEEFKDKYLGALIWTTRLGNAAKLDIQVVMRQLSNFYKATPDYWVSLLHKTLVGRQVLELKFQSQNNESYVHLYSQCTKLSTLYDKGAITIFGVNLTPREVTANLKGLKIKILHKYILSPDTETDNKMLSEKILLNNKPLDLINDEELPNLNPEIVTKPDDLELKLSSGNIGFWVIPNAKVKACAYPEEETTEVMKKRLSKRHKNIIRHQEKKINDADQHSVQESERRKRDVGQKLVEIGLRKDSVLKKRLRLDNVKDINERKTKRRDDSRRDELVPFNPRTTDSGENNFYGFFRHEPIKGFPESDIFITTGDSLEQNNKDYDYVQDESNENDSEVKHIQRRKELQTQNHTEDDTWLEMENDYIPNEFFENVKINARIQESPKNYSDLWEAEFSPQENSSVLQEQLSIEKTEKRAVENNMQKLINYYDSKEQRHDRDTKYEDHAMRKSSMPLSQFVETPIYINHQASITKPEERKLKLQSGASSFFYQPSQATINYNYNNHRAKNTRHEENESNKEEIFDVNILNDRDNINTETVKFSQPADVNTEYSIHEMQYPILHDRRAKRSNAKIQKDLANEMIKENQKNSKNRRIIQASHLSKKLRRAKRDSKIFADSSSEIRNAQSKINVEDSITKEEYEKITAGEILSSTITNSITSVESDCEEHNTTTETITTESSTLKYRPSYETQTIDVSSTSIMDNSGIDDISKRYHNINNSNVKRFVNSEFSPINEQDSNDITKEMFFRTEPSDVETTTYDPSQIMSKIYSINNKSDLQEPVVASATENAQKKTREETQNLISKKEKADSSSCPTITESQKDKGWRDNHDKIRLRKSMSSLETTKRIAEEQMTTETILPKLITDRTIDSSTKSSDNIQENVEDDRNVEFKALTQSKKNIDAKKLKTTRRKTSKGHARYVKKLNNEQMDKLNRRLMKKLMFQYYHDELTKIVDVEKRNLRRRETWESEDFHLIDQGEFIGILIDDDVLHKDTNNENYGTPIEFVKKIRYPKYNKVYQFPRHLKVIEDDGESIEYHQHSEHLPKMIKDEQEASRFSDHERNQDCRHSAEMLEDERESEETSKSDDNKIFVIDPSTYRGGQPILQLHEKHSKLPYKYYPKIKLENQNPIPRRMLEKIYQVISKSTSSEDRVSKLQEYMKKTSTNKNYDQGNANVVYILDEIQRQHNRPNNFARFAQNSLGRQNINQTVNNKTAADLNNIYKNLENHNNSNKSTIDKNMELTTNARIKKYIENEKSINYHDEKEDIMNNVKKTEDTIKNTERNMIPKNIGTDKEEMLNIKRFNAIMNEYKIAKDTREIIKPYNSNEETQNNINMEISDNNKTTKNVEKVIDNNVKLSKFKRGNTRKERDINTQRRDYLKQLLHFL